MKTNIKMRVTPEQSKRVQEICFENKIFWIVSKNTFCDYPLIYIKPNVLVADADHEDDFEEIDADLFIRTNGTCEEDELKNFIQSQNEIKDGINEWAKQFNDIEQKLKKKNEILKKARIKRKNQREELHKLNLKLQKCIGLEEHRKVINWHIERNQSLFAEIDNLKAENIKMGKLVNLNKSALDLAVITKELAISRLEGYTMSHEGMKRTNVLYDNIDLLMKYFEDKNKELDL